MEFQIIYVRYSEFLQNLHRVFRQMTSEIAITRVMSLFFNFFIQFCDDMEFYFSLFLAEFFFQCSQKFYEFNCLDLILIQFFYQQ